MLMRIVLPRRARADDETAVRKPCMTLLQLLLTDEVHRRIIVGEVVRHRYDRLLDRRRICALLEHDIALTRMLLARRERRIRAAAHGLECRGNRHGVLLGIPHPRDTADRI